MAFEATFAELVIKWSQLSESVQALRITTVEDQPLTGAVLLVERYSDAAEDLLGWAKEGLAAAVESRDAIGAVLDLHRARRALATSQERFGRLSDEFFGFASLEQLGELLRFGRRLRGEWLAWAKTVRNASLQCEAPLRGVREALAGSWQELTEHLGTTSVTLQTTNIGQQISPVGSDLKESTRTGLT